MINISSHIAVLRDSLREALVNNKGTAISLIIFICSFSAIATLSFYLFIYIYCISPIILPLQINIGSLKSCAIIPNSLANKNVLGAQAQKIESEKHTLEKSVEFWKSILVNYPDYEDAYIQIISLSYTLQNKEDVRTYVNLLEKLNPNHPRLSDLKNLID